MLHVAWAAIAAAILYVAFGALGDWPEALAGEEDHGPPPLVGDTLIPTPRLVCQNSAALEYIFEGGRDLETVQSRARITTNTLLADTPLCARGEFDETIKVLSAERIGSVLIQGTEMAAWAVEIEYEWSEPFWMLWLENAGSET